jgi:maltooligosyltrehalose trehalohydrolase
MKEDSRTSGLGALFLHAGKVHFRVWAPLAESLSVEIVSQNRVEPLVRSPRGYFEQTLNNVHGEDRYFYLFPDGSRYPDPASRFQPEGVHGPSQVVDPSGFSWEDTAWRGILLQDYVIYELHVGTFTAAGTFESIIPCLPHLRDLGITAIELMPVAQFPGGRNWGYDGVYPFAPQNTYGGPRGLNRLVDACHAMGFSVIADVVCNHLGPEGNYLSRFGPYCTDRYRTPWGEAINFDGPWSDEVRHYFISNALYWIMEYHFDALRLDAVHGIFDHSARHFLREITEEVHLTERLLNRNVYVMAESDLNDVRLIDPVEMGGYGLDAQWNDDFHHALHVLTTKEQDGYFQDFGELGHLAAAFTEKYVYSGQFSRFRNRRHGNSARLRPPSQFVVFSQNHDQVGNRKMGDRFSAKASFEQLKLAAATVLLSPFIPLLFMGEEYGETAPFLYFVSHSDAQLIAAVRDGRQREFASFQWGAGIPDPQDEKTFLQSKISREPHLEGHQKTLFDYYRNLIRLRKRIWADVGLPVADYRVKAFEEQRVISVRRHDTGGDVVCLFSFNDSQTVLTLTDMSGLWENTLDSTSARWGGAGGGAVKSIKHGGAEVSILLGAYNVLVYEEKTGQDARRVYT